MNTGPNWFMRLDKKNRIAFLLSLFWIVVVPFFVIPYAGESGGPAEHFLLWGIFPLCLYWGRRLWMKKWL